MDCIFCKILEGGIPSYKLYEDEYVYAFLDITQATRGHTLIIPKTHIKNVYDLDEKLAANLFRVVPKIARALKKSFNPIGMNIISNNELPLQSVFHFHIHLIPRFNDDGMKLSMINNYGKNSEEEFLKTVDLIVKNIL